MLTERDSGMADGLGKPSGRGRRSARLEAIAWVIGWLAGLISLLTYIYISEKATLWVWSALLLLALLSPTPSTYRRVAGQE